VNASDLLDDVATRATDASFALVVRAEAVRARVLSLADWAHDVAAVMRGDYWRAGERTQDSRPPPAPSPPEPGAGREVECASVAEAVSRARAEPGLIFTVGSARFSTPAPDEMSADLSRLSTTELEQHLRRDFEREHAARPRS